MRQGKLYLLFEYAMKLGIGGAVFFLPMSSALIEIFFCIALIGFIGKKVIKPNFRFLNLPHNIFLCAFYMCISLSLINAGQYMSVCISALFFKWGESMLFFLIAQDIVEENKDVLFFVAILLCSSFIVSLSALTQYLWGIEFLRGRHVVSTVQVASGLTACFKHYNAFGAYLLIPFALCFAFISTKKGRWGKEQYLCTGFWLLLVFCLFQTYSRGAWIGAFAAAILMSLFTNKRIMFIPMALMVVIVLCMPEFRDRFVFIFEKGGDADRFKYWTAAIEMFRNNPFFGKGVGTFMKYYKDYVPAAKLSCYAHNSFLQILAETGILSFIAFIGFIGVILFKGIKKSVITKNPLLIGSVCGLFGFLVHSFFENTLYSISLSALFWIWMGIVAKFVYIPDDKTRFEQVVGQNA